MITLSANGGNDGVVWGSVPVKGNWQGHDNNGNANHEIVEGVLRAYDASTFAGTDSSGNPQMKLLRQPAGGRHLVHLRKVLSARGGRWQGSSGDL